MNETGHVCATEAQARAFHAAIAEVINITAWPGKFQSFNTVCKNSECWALQVPVGSVPTLIENVDLVWKALVITAHPYVNEHTKEDLLETLWGAPGAKDLRTQRITSEREEHVGEGVCEDSSQASLPAQSSSDQQGRSAVYAWRRSVW